MHIFGWVVLVLFSVFSFSYTSYRAINCRVVECEGFSPTSILGAVIVLVIVFVIKSRAGSLPKTLSVAAVGLLAYGLNVGGVLCPTWAPNC